MSIFKRRATDGGWAGLQISGSDRRVFPMMFSALIRGLRFAAWVGATDALCALSENGYRIARGRVMGQIRPPPNRVSQAGSFSDSRPCGSAPRVNLGHRWPGISLAVGDGWFFSRRRKPVSTEWVRRTVGQVAEDPPVIHPL